MRILILKHGDVCKPGGINENIRKICSRLVKHNNQCAILSFDHGSSRHLPLACACRCERVHSRTTKLTYGLVLDSLNVLRDELRAFDPDIVHVHGYHGLFSVEMMVMLKKILRTRAKVVFTPHYDPRNRATLAGRALGNLFDAAVGRNYLRLADSVVSVSRFEERNLRQILRVEGPISLIPHGVDFIDTEKDFSKRNEYRLLVVSYLLEYKGVQHIIMALHELVNLRHIGDIRLTIIGEGAYKGQLMALSERLGVDSNIDWRPFMSHEETLKEMKKADVFLLLSSSEGYGLVVAEALSMGTPAIVTKGTALEEFAQERGCFSVEYPPDPKVVADTVLSIRRSRVHVGPFTDKIRTWDVVAQDYEDLYTSLAEMKTLTHSAPRH